MRAVNVLWQRKEAQLAHVQAEDTHLEEFQVEKLCIYKETAVSWKNVCLLGNPQLLQLLHSSKPENHLLDI